MFGYTRPDALEAAFTQIQTPNGTVNTTGAQTADPIPNGAAMESQVAALALIEAALIAQRE